MGEIVVFLILSAIVGGLIGSVLCRAMARRDLEDRIDHTYRTHAAELSEVRARLDDRNVEIVNLTDQLAEAQGRLRSVETELAAADRTEADAELIEELRRQLEDAASRAVAAESARDAALREVTEEDEELARKDEAIRALEIELADMRVALSQSDDVDPPAQLSIDATGAVGEARARVAEIAVRTRGEHPEEDDDLTEIHGVGPKLSAMLKDMGITSFRQVSAFTSDDIRIVSEALEAFPDRIERDDWIGSARDLHRRKYGGDPG